MLQYLFFFRGAVELTLRLSQDAQTRSIVPMSSRCRFCFFCRRNREGGGVYKYADENVELGTWVYRVSDISK